MASARANSLTSSHPAPNPDLRFPASASPEAHLAHPLLSRGAGLSEPRPPNPLLPPKALIFYLHRSCNVQSHRGHVNPSVLASSGCFTELSPAQTGKTYFPTIRDVGNQGDPKRRCWPSWSLLAAARGGSASLLFGGFRGLPEASEAVAWLVAPSALKVHHLVIWEFHLAPRPRLLLIRSPATPLGHPEDPGDSPHLRMRNPVAPATPLLPRKAPLAGAEGQDVDFPGGRQSARCLVLL